MTSILLPPPSLPVPTAGPSSIYRISPQRMKCESNQIRQSSAPATAVSFSRRQRQRRGSDPLAHVRRAHSDPAKQETVLESCSTTGSSASKRFQLYFKATSLVKSMAEANLKLPLASRTDQRGRPTFSPAQMEEMLAQLPTSCPLRQRYHPEPILEEAFIPYLDDWGLCINLQDRSYNHIRSTPIACDRSLVMNGKGGDAHCLLPPSEYEQGGGVFDALCHAWIGSNGGAAAETDELEQLWWDMRLQTSGRHIEARVRRWLQSLTVLQQQSSPLNRFPIAEAFAQYEAFYPRFVPGSSEVAETPQGSRSEMNQLPHEILTMVSENLDLYNLIMLGELSAKARHRVIELLDQAAKVEIHRRYPWLLPVTQEEQKWFAKQAQWAAEWMCGGFEPLPTLKWDIYVDQDDEKCDLSEEQLRVEQQRGYCSPQIGRPSIRLASPWLGSGSDASAYADDTDDKHQSPQLQQEQQQILMDMPHNSSDASCEICPNKIPWYAYLRVCLDDACWSMVARKAHFGRQAQVSHVGAF